MNFTELMEYLSDLLWGNPFVYGTIAVALYLTVRSGFFTIRHFGHIFSATFGKKSVKSKEEGTISSYEALCVAVGGAVGTGNISGVAAAIAVGGPGAIFWLWVYAFLGMTAKMVEVTLGCFYRSKTPDGSFFGGPTYYMIKGLHLQRGWKVGILLAWAFGMFFSLQWLVSGQPYAVAESMNTSFGIPPILVLFCYAGLVFWTINRGITGLGKFASKVVPFMSAAYILGSVTLILMNFSEIPHVFELIFSGAFTGTAATGGFVGSTVRVAVQRGLSRAVNSNEAGQGTSPMIHASADTIHPIRQGLWGTVEVFIDTVLLCSCTALAILCTGVWSNGLTSVTLTTSAFESEFGSLGVMFIGCMMLIFGLTTNGGWYSYYNTLLNHALSNGSEERRLKALKLFRFVYPLPSLLFTSMLFFTDAGGNVFWTIIDVTIAIPIYINLICLLLLSGTFFKLLKDYQARYMSIGKVDPSFRYFYDTEPNAEAKKHDTTLK